MITQMKSFKQILNEVAARPLSLPIANRFSKYIELNKTSRENRSKLYKGRDSYQDDIGANWLDIKAKDYDTLFAAFIDGIRSKSYCKQFSSQTEFNEYVYNNPHFAEKFEKIYNDLKHYMTKGFIKLYRGLSLDSKQAWLKQAILKNPRILQRPNSLLDYVNNTTKPYNSFSPNIKVARNYASLDDNIDSYIIISRICREQ